MGGKNASCEDEAEDESAGAGKGREGGGGGTVCPYAEEKSLDPYKAFSADVLAQLRALQPGPSAPPTLNHTRRLEAAAM